VVQASRLLSARQAGRLHHKRLHHKPDTTNRIGYEGRLGQRVSIIKTRAGDWAAGFV
jgi:hypothetical protein